MKNAVWFISYELNKGASEKDFLAVSKQLCDEHISKQKGYISWKQFRDGKTWVDMATWQTMEDAVTFEKNSEVSEPLPIAQKFYSFINFETLKSTYYTVEASY